MGDLYFKGESMHGETVSYFVYEGTIAYMERTIRRLWVLCIIIFLAFVGSNVAWMYYESQWEVVESTSQDVRQNIDTGDGDAVITGIGDIYGENPSIGEGN